MKKDEFVRKKGLYLALKAKGLQQRALLEEEFSTLSQRSIKIQKQQDSVLNELKQEGAIGRAGLLNPTLMTMASRRVIYLNELKDELLSQRKTLDKDVAELNQRLMINSHRIGDLDQRLIDVKDNRKATLGFVELMTIDELSRLGFQGEN